MSKGPFYADQFQPRFGVPWPGKLTDELLATMSNEQIAKALEARQMIERGQLENPVGWGYTLPSWELAMDCWPRYNITIMLGGNQSGKTTYGSRLITWAANQIPEAECYCFHVNEMRSIADQQRFVWEALPERLKNLPTKKGIAHSLQYSQKNGFTDGVAIMPPMKGYKRGGSIRFMNYQQYFQNQQVAEGIKVHCGWFDEMPPVDLFDTFRMGRLGTYHGRLLVTYTTVTGWNPLIERILSKTRTLKTVFSNHPKIMAHVPLLQESLSVPSCCIIYAHTDQNCFVDSNEFWKLYATEPKDVILARAYGVPTKSVTAAFQNFSKEYAENGGNVVKHEDLPFVKKRLDAKGKEIPYPVTRYHSIDPAGSKSWFMVWVAVDPSGTWWVYHEFPNHADWALSGDKPGDGQTPTIHGIKAYAESIRQDEGEDQIYERIIDPRMSAAERQTADGATTLLSELDDAGIVCIPAPAAASESNRGEIEDGILLLSELLNFKKDQPQDAINRPKLFISDRCQNVIFAMSEYTGKLGATENTKDPIDCLRYLRKANIQYVPPVRREDTGSAGVY